MSTNPEPANSAVWSILSCMSEDYALLDAQGVTTAFGPGDTDQLGRTRAEAVGVSAFERVHPDDLVPARGLFAALLGQPGGVVAMDVRCQHRDGSWRWLRARGTNLLHEPSLRRVVATFKDITEERRAADEVAARTALGMRIADALDGGLWVRRLPEWEMLFLSEGLSRIWGVPACELFSSPDRMLQAVHPADRAVVARRLNRPPEPDEQLEYRILRPGGEERTLLTRRVLVADERDGPLLAGVTLDITDQVRLRAAASRAENFEAVARLSLRLAHDFGNFIAAIQASVDTLDAMTRNTAILDEVALIGRSCARAGEVVGRLLLVGRGSASDPVTLDLTRELAESMTVLRRAATPGVDVLLQCSLDCVRVRIDPVELHQVLLNLVANASHAMLGRGTIVIGVVRDADEGVLTVSDTGPGVPPDLRGRVFDPFATTRRGNGGSGLGLTAVRAVVEGAGGSVSVGAAEGGGACFEVRLPLAQGAP